MCADGGHEDLGRRHPGQGEMARFGLYFSIGFPAGPDTPEGLQAWKFMVIRQTLSGNHRAGAGLLAAMPGLLVMRDQMVWRNLAETRTGHRTAASPGWLSAPGNNRHRLW
jgi:hypothetical protein